MADSWEFEEGASIAEERTVLRRLGGGSRYEVYLAWDEYLFSIVVAKILRPDLAEDERALRELAEEADVLDALAHPVIVRGFDAVLEGPHPHVLIEHLEGPSLRRLIKRGGPIPLQQLLPLALHVAGALEYMSHEGLVHLDVKPDNIIMGVPPRLIDLSIARSFERAARTSSPIGTDAYMAPEQCNPAAHGTLIGSASDVWGLGATLHHAVSGSVPFSRREEDRDSEDPAVRFPQLADEPGPLPDGLPGELRELILATLRKAPAERPTAAEIAAALEPLVAELPSKLVLSRRGARLG
ncbi:MAG TPA: serine/threonine-protein kinase [Solirubrobacterales bacterium]|nr:serine/threonine-protein kinase [Solirubrobacterales bacterium]